MNNIVINIVHAANIDDSKAANLVIRNLKENIQGIKIMYAACVYMCELGERVKKSFGYALRNHQKLNMRHRERYAPRDG